MQNVGQRRCRSLWGWFHNVQLLLRDHQTLGEAALANVEFGLLAGLGSLAGILCVALTLLRGLGSLLAEKESVSVWTSGMADWACWRLRTLPPPILMSCFVRYEKI